MKPLYLLVCIALPAAVSFGPQPGRALSPVRSQQNSPVKSFRAERCRIELLETHVTKVSATQTGRLNQVEPANIGDPVKEDNIVARIDTEVIDARIKAADMKRNSEIEIDYAKSSHAMAKNDYDRMVRSRDQGKNVYSQKELERGRLDVTKTQLQINKAMHDKDIAESEYQVLIAERKQYEMTAPRSGVVSKVFKKRGETVRVGDDIMEVTDISEIRAIGRIPMSKQRDVRRGDLVRVRILDSSEGGSAAYKEIFEGKITYITPSVDTAKHHFEVYATIVNKPDRLNGGFILKSGMPTEMAVYPRTAAAVATPRAASASRK